MESLIKIKPHTRWQKTVKEVYQKQGTKMNMEIFYEFQQSSDIQFAGKNCMILWNMLPLRSPFCLNKFFRNSQANHVDAFYISH